jgi:hypothetical protein
VQEKSAFRQPGRKFEGVSAAPVGVKECTLHERESSSVGSTMTLGRIISAAEVHFEKEYEEFQREGIDTHGPETAPKKGDELWF